MKVFGYHASHQLFSVEKRYRGIIAVDETKINGKHLYFGLHNPVEQWFRIFKHRIHLFYKR